MARRGAGLGLVILLASAAHTACATRAFVRPTGPGTPAPDVREAWASAGAACGAVRSYAGTLRLTGRIADQRIRGMASATIDVAIDDAARVGLEARISGQLAFRLGGTADRAVLWLRDGNRVVTAEAAELLAALVGARFAPARLREVLAGCPVGVPLDAFRVNNAIVARVGDAMVEMRQAQGAWRVTSWWFGDWDVVYENDASGHPEQITVSSRADVTPAVRLSLGVSHAEQNVDVPASAFVVEIPDGARAMTLDELRASGPLADSGPANR